MSILSWLPFGRKNDTSRPDAGRGAFTGCDLSDAAQFDRPFVQDPFYRLRPPFRMEAARMSLELAAAAYTLELDPWRAAGWNDFSILIDDSLQSSLTHDEDGDAISGVSNRLKLLRAKAALKEYNPLSQLAGALRQREKSDTVKAVCMMHPLADGKFLVAIGFMGTGKRFYDWISNLRFTPEEGFHRGFYQLCESFELNAEDMVFPAAASALGLEKLTLGEVFSEMRSLSSRFRLWMAGHSQGGAVMQVLTHRLIYDWGIPAQNITGISFGSPTVATGRFVHDPAAYPLYHILNRDDPVTRMGALLHLGLCLEYEPDEAFRTAVYGLSTEENDVALRDSLAFFEDGMQDMPSALAHLSALLQVLAEEKGAEGLNDLLTSWWSVPVVDKMLWRAGDKAMDLLDRLLGSAEDAYLALTGRPMDDRELTALRSRIRPLVQSASSRRLLEALSALSAVPHRLFESEKGRGNGAYAAILSRGRDSLKPFIWIKASAGLPVRRYAGWTEGWPQPDFPVFARAKRQSVRTQLRGRMRTSYTARRAR